MVDASVVVDLLILGGRDAKLTKLFLAQTGKAFAPELIDLEVVQALRRWAIRGAIKPDRALASIEVLQALPIKRLPHRPFVNRIWQLRHSLTAYDAAYVALAEGLQAPLFTRDRKLAAAGGNSARIELV